MPAEILPAFFRKKFLAANNSKLREKKRLGEPKESRTQYRY
jgi:hypothetical protein